MNEIDLNEAIQHNSKQSQVSLVSVTYQANESPTKLPASTVFHTFPSDELVLKLMKMVRSDHMTFYQLRRRNRTVVELLLKRRLLP